jgi:hypothetical protein
MAFRYLIDVDNIVSGTALIIAHPTGIFMTAQCGGVGCSHPSIEGFAIDLGSFMDDFDDCKYGCHHIPDLSEEEKKRLASDIDAELSNFKPFMIRFDFDRIEEMQEGWWPIKVKGEIDKWNRTHIDSIGFIHNGNCD